jgi:hypothetical protein
MPALVKEWTFYDETNGDYMIRALWLMFLSAAHDKNPRKEAVVLNGLFKSDVWCGLITAAQR